MGFGGLAVDKELRVIKQDGKPIPNLYAAGEIIGSAATMGRANRTSTVLAGSSASPSTISSTSGGLAARTVQTRKRRTPRECRSFIRNSRWR